MSSSKVLVKRPKPMPEVNLVTEGVTSSVDHWYSIITSNEYISKKKESVKDPHSFCALVDRPLTQSQNITLGNCMEHLFHDIIAKNTQWKDMSETRTKKGEHQTDHLWLNEETREIIYAEQKNNIKLDTEKTIKTESKIAEVVLKHPDYTVKSFILAARYLDTNEPLAQELVRKYKTTTIIGINQYLSMFGLSGFPDYETYKLVIRKVVDTKFGTE